MSQWVSGTFHRQLPVRLDNRRLSRALTDYQQEAEASALQPDQKGKVAGSGCHLKSLALVCACHLTVLRYLFSHGATGPNRGPKIASTLPHPWICEFLGMADGF